MDSSRKGGLGKTSTGENITCSDSIKRKREDHWHDRICKR